MSTSAPLLVLRMAEPTTTVAVDRVWGVSALLLATSDTLQARFGALAVRGELSGLTRAASGHCYFSLKDLDGRAALLRCAMFRRAAVLLDFTPADGQQVEVRGRLAVFEPRGEMQFVVESMQAAGDGALYEQFLRLKARLEAAGLFDAARKRRIARWPRTLGIVTSTAAAALHDVLATLSRRAPHVRVVIYPSPVQGGDAAASLAAMIRVAGERSEVDTLLLVRGGGSLQDLWSFNDERLVRAIGDSSIPLVCGVGHESDVTLADMAADMRAATPTAAAELAAPSRAEALMQLAALQATLRRRATHLVDLQAQRVDALAQRLGAPARVVQHQRQQLQAHATRLRLALQRAAERARFDEQHCGRSLVLAMRRQHQRLRVANESLSQQLQALDPTRILARGYVWITDADGRAVVSINEVHAGARLQAVWADGSATVDVHERRAGTPLA